jgi:hypothetical protein
MNILVVGNPNVGSDVAVYLGEHNIPFVNLKEWDSNGEKYLGKNVLVIKNDTKLSDLIRVIELEQNNKPIIIEALPKFEEPRLLDLKDFDKPFYHGLYSKGGKKNKKRFGR